MKDVDKIFAMVSEDGTPSAPTVLCKKDYLVEDNRREAEDNRDDNALYWDECSSDPSLECVVCGGSVPTTNEPEDADAA